MDVLTPSKKSFPYYPFLLTSYSFLSFWSVNIAAPENLAGLIPYYFVALSGLLVFWLLGSLLLKNFLKGSFLTAALAFVFFGYGHASNLLQDWIPWIPLKRLWLLILFSLLPPGAFWLCRKRQNSFFLKATVFLNIFLGLALIPPLSNIAAYSLYPPRLNLAGVQRPPLKLGDRVKPEQYPDIYYILLDEYAREDMLEKYFDFSNQPFLSQLKEKGFYIANDSHSNYGYTTASMTSLLFMNYVHEIAPDHDTREGMFEEMNKKNRVARFLKRMGYKYIVFDSAIFDFTSDGPLVDEFVTGTGISELETVFFNTTLLTLLAQQLLSEEWRNSHLYHFRRLGEIPLEPEHPKFVLAHFLLPHPPFVFNAVGGRVDGRKISMNMVRPDIYARDYLGQLIYTNQLVLKAVEQILSFSRREPVIIIQSDHGAEWIARGAEWWESREALQERFSNLTAVHLPSGMPNHYYSDITLVNIFRILFRDLFDAQLELLPDRSFLDCEVDRNQIDACNPSGIGFHEITQWVKASPAPKAA